MKVRTLAYSTWLDVRLMTLEVEVPAHVWGQVTRHRGLSFSARSARAWRTKDLIEEACYEPPKWFEKGTGMQPGEEITSLHRIAQLRRLWCSARSTAIATAAQLADQGVAKELANRVLAPYVMTKAVITGTDKAWQHFLDLRLAHAAQYETRVFAEFVRDALAAEPVWKNTHLPYYGPEYGHLTVEEQLHVCAARCARVSYPDKEKIDVKADLDLAKRLVRDRHWSPFEHVAVALDKKKPKTDFGNFEFPWHQVRKQIGG